MVSYASDRWNRIRVLFFPLLVFAIKKFKVLVSNYFAKTSLEKQKRKADKIKQKYAILNPDSTRNKNQCTTVEKYKRS